ncbi:MAG: NADH-quinone oxidoreductase subunit NuoE [Armatimonadota bacterium]|nr:NADH-quinone oxidoreductase subunit NuoE [bacterium]
MECTCRDDNLCELTEYIKGVFNPEHPQSALIAILHHAQGMYGYLSRDVMEHIAQVTEVPAAEIYGVATFYSFFKHTPQGKHQIHVCMGTACYIRGGAKLLETLEDMLNIKPGETTEDMLFTLGETRCIGACGLAPVMMIDDKVYGRVEPEQLKGILDEYRTEMQA